LEFRGERVDDRLQSWLTEGCDLEPRRAVRQTDGSLLYTPIPNTFLVLEAGGGKRAAVVSSQTDPWKQTARVVGYRAIKLATRSGRFRLRLVNADSGRPLLTGLVLANSRGFDALTDSDRLPSPDRDGYVVATRPFDRLAYISISQQRDLSFRLLLPITRDWCELECKLPADRQAREKDNWRRQLRYAIQDIQVLQATLDQQVRRINELNGNKRYEEALRAAQSVSPELQPLVRSTQQSVDETMHLADPIGMREDPMLAWARQQVADIERRIEEVAGLGGDLKRAIEDLDARDRAKVLVKLAGQAEQNGDIEDAIQRYELALNEWGNQPEVQRHLDELKEVWKIKGPEHQRARDFVFQTLAGAHVDELQELLPDADDAFRALVGVGDYLSVRRLANLNGQFLGELADNLESLSGQGGTQEFERYQQLADRLAALQAEVLEYRKAQEEGRPYEPPPKTSAGLPERPSDDESPQPPQKPTADRPTQERPPAAEPDAQPSEPEMQPDMSEPGDPQSPPAIGIDEQEEPPLE
jgi:tetratricopeptide (TPR) repeat protein